MEHFELEHFKGPKGSSKERILMAGAAVAHPTQRLAARIEKLDEEWEELAACVATQHASRVPHGGVNGRAHTKGGASLLWPFIHMLHVALSSLRVWRGLTATALHRRPMLHCDRAVPGHACCRAEAGQQLPQRAQAQSDPTGRCERDGWQSERGRRRREAGI